MLLLKHTLCLDSFSLAVINRTGGRKLITAREKLEKNSVFSKNLLTLSSSLVLCFMPLQ
jgi:hypothetical protein